MAEFNNKRARNKSFDRSFGLQWHVTDRCDQRCKHCYIWRRNKKGEILPCTKKELNLSQCIKVVDKFLSFCKKFKVNPFINITGGDPLLFPLIWDLLDYIKTRNVSFRILGNPFHLNENVCRKLKILGCKAYQMSLDGLKETHDNIRKTGSFEVTFSAIERLKKAGIRTVIMSTVSRWNYHDIPKLIKLVVDVNADVYDFARYCPVSDDTDTQFSPQEYREFLSEVWEIFKKLTGRKTLFPMKDNLWTLWLYENGLFRTRRENLVFQGCGCGIKHLTLLPDGIVYACRRFKSPVGNILSQSFEQVFLGKKIEKYRKIEKLEDCRNCELLNYCRGCHAVSYGVYNNFFAKDPQCWRFQKEQKTQKG